MVMVIECESCQSRFRLAKVLFKESKAIRVRCRKCGGYIVVENPDLHEPEPLPPRLVPRIVPPPEPEQGQEQVTEPEPAAPTMDETTRAMVELLREIDETVVKPPEKPPEIPPEIPLEVSAPHSELPPELIAPDAGSGRKSGYQGPLRVTPYPEQPDGSEALASVLEDLFKPGPGASSTGHGPAPQADPDRAAEPKKSSAPKEPAQAPPARPPYASPFFIVVVVLWVLLLVGAALLFGTDYFDTWFSSWRYPQTESAVMEPTPSNKASFEIRDLKWFTDNTFDGGTLFAVTGTLTVRGRSVLDGIRVRATIMGKDNAVISEKVVVAGNYIDNAVLRHTKPDVIDSFLTRKADEAGGVREILVGEALPFMAVFFDPPERVHSVLVKPVTEGK